ncbi:MAG: nickel/cobalt transporter [Roseiarcus sp.]
MSLTLRPSSLLRLAFVLGAVALVVVCASHEAAAGMMTRPFSVGGFEGGGSSTGVTGWLLAEQSWLTHLMSRHITSLAANPNAFWGLAGLGLAYGVFHAAGPGHGKAVIASYMMASDRAVRRGILLALLAALLQGAVAVALVGVAALIFNATAGEMNVVADTLAQLSYAGIVAIGAWLTWRKGRVLIAAVRDYSDRRVETAEGALFAGAPWRAAPVALGGPFRVETPGRGVCPEGACGHAHAPDPSALEDGFSWRGAAATVVAAGSRPCSGSILVLVFALAQGVFAAGIAATFAISIGAAVTTGALAVGATYAKKLSLRFAAGESCRVALVARSFEFAAALAVLGFGLALWFAAGVGA